MILFFSVILTLASVMMIVLILMHKGRGGGLSDMFGGGVSSSLGGSSVAERNLDRITVGVAAVWAVSVVALGLLMKVSA
ncbi:preprotein translocase subunit SecG [Aeromicrobium halocynthiae]|uniref:Protein-export membrane protein SecG n=1 Tax=Aeromicrobium halocynthiae TaxID=560557 RepID=A0ABN2VPK3_9ACTN